MWNYHNLTFIILCIFIARAFYVARNNWYHLNVYRPCRYGIAVLQFFYSLHFQST
jgi:hypothetical protein